MDCVADGNLKYTKPLFIVGSTASGKSELAFRLAKKLDGVIISADSMQIYRGLDIGTAKESASRRVEVEYKMLDVVNFDETYSVAEYALAAKQCIEDALKCNKLPIVVGGTGLYIEALVYPMSFSHAPKNDALREELNIELETYGAKHMHGKLAEVDPESAEKLHENDTKRVIRALEIVLTTGKTRRENSDAAYTPDATANYASNNFAIKGTRCETGNVGIPNVAFNNIIPNVASNNIIPNVASNNIMPNVASNNIYCETGNVVHSPDVIMIGLNTERAALYDRINKRVDIMFKSGLVEEVASVCNFDYQSMQAIGYKEFKNAEFEIINGKININETCLSEIKDKIKQDTRNYAKRQITWFKKYSFAMWFDCNDLDGAEIYAINMLNQNK